MELRRGPSRANMTYHRRINESAPAFLLFEEGQNEGNGSRTEENNDQLVLELLKNKLPDGGGGFFGNSCTRRQVSKAVHLPTGSSWAPQTGGKHTVLSPFLAQGLDLVVLETGPHIDLEVGQDLVGGLGEGVLHISRAAPSASVRKEGRLSMGASDISRERRRPLCELRGCGGDGGRCCAGWRGQRVWSRKKKIHRALPTENTT